MGDVDVPPDHSQASKDGVTEDIMPSGQGPSDHSSPDSRKPLIKPPTQPLESSHIATRPHSERRSAPHGYPGPGSHRALRTALNMADMTSALPCYQASARPFSQQNVHQQFIHTHQPQGIIYPVHQMPYLNQNASGGTMYNPPYSPPYHNPYIQQQSQLQLGYSPYHGSHNHQIGAAMPPQSSAFNTVYFTQNPYGPSYGEMQATVNIRMEGQPNLTNAEYRRSQQFQPSNTKESEKRKSPAHYDVSQTIVDGSSSMKQPRASVVSVSARLPLVTISNTPPRGPPRKPKQSGHALWVGNLPPSTNVVDLKDHFSRDATSDIESVFLISKSNCAFVNYKTEAACAAAVARFHDSNFQGVRLVCRSRRGAGAGSGQNNPPSARPGDEGQAPSEDEDMATKLVEEPHAGHAHRPSRVPERFFIVKSLTVEDLELSRRSGIWATQTHNEAALNQAYESADNVYLIFSANKSGEYFGYARMASAIADDETLALEVPPRPENPSAEADDLDVMSTEATTTAPKGRIIDDSARGTIFWEADSSEDDGDSKEDDSENEENEENGEDEVDDDTARSERSTAELGGEDANSGGQTFGKPFRIEWMSTERVPFYRTRGLRNPWNSNREVKIARDGTEIEPSVGRKLTQLFHVPSNVISSFQRPY
ncbi:hypothetical protein UA08_03924 [Talaromyces atroroseus]|uniref:RRM domain-containing protein n=1 Tax=Talaromyces atroroseus TaxID=1441469 RepID=A0A225AZX3_TALAT|nr:hypothetical protein UA08_03924 [Talaromyces atroroseus]OKL61259.1 hypothetical protein UA08_03924 [Talaromyces atroroseus]